MRMMSMLWNVKNRSRVEAPVVVVADILAQHVGLLDRSSYVIISDGLVHRLVLDWLLCKTISNGHNNNNR